VLTMEKKFPSCTWKLGYCFEISRKEMGPSELFPFSFPLGLASFLQQRDSIVHTPIVVAAHISFQGGSSATAPSCFNIC